VKIKKLLGIIAFVAIIGLAFTACGDGGDGGNGGGCSHEFTLWQETTAPTCTVAAIDTAKCSKCSVFGTETKTGRSALGHDWDYADGSLLPTCIDEGNGSRECKRSGCGVTEDDLYFDALGHQGLTPAFAATCTAAGNSEASGTCTRTSCGQEITGTIIPALEHLGLTPAFEATCTVAGNSEEGTCTRAGCGQPDIIGTVIPALGHQGLTPAFAATCTAAGNSEEGTCTRVGCTNPNVTGTVINALGHDHVSSLICKRTGCDHRYALGDTGPAGGKIIYVAPAGFQVTSTTAAFTTYTAYYLEAAPANAVGGTGSQTEMRWSTRSSSPYPDPTGTAAAIGRGRNNTALIIATEKAAYPSDTYIYAALACDNYSVAGFNDWFLPNRDELTQLYNRRVALGLSSGSFWSSSRAGVNNAWGRVFQINGEYEYDRGTDRYVRPIRAF